MKVRQLVKISRERLRSRDNQWIGLIFALPFIIGFVFIFINMFVQGIWFAFAKVSVRGGLSTEYAGFKNIYYALRVDASFIRIMFNEIQSLLTTIPIILIFSLFVAVVLNSDIWGRTAFRAIFFLPVIVCTGLISTLDTTNYVMSSMNAAATDTDSAVLSAMGDVTRFLQQLEFSPELISTVSNAANNVMEIVNRSGVQIIIFLAGIQSISPSIYESAKVEGASSWEMFWKITLPMVTPMLLVNIIYSFIESMTRDNTTMMSLIKKMAFTKGDYGVAAAMSWLYFLTLGLMLGLLLLIIWRGVVIFQKRRKGVY